MHRAHHVAVRGQGFGIRHARDAEIADFHLTRAGNHHVLRLYIPVDDAPLMSVPQRRQNLQEMCIRDRVNHEQAARQVLHLADAAQVLQELLALGHQLDNFLLRQHFKLAALFHRVDGRCV